MALPKSKGKSQFLAAFFVIALFFANNLRPTTNSTTPELVASKFLEYYFSFQDAKKFEEDSDFVQASVTYNRASSLLKEIQSLDPSWRPAFINVKLRELQSAIVLMNYHQTMSQANNLLSLGQVEQAKENYLAAKSMLNDIKHNTPGWREDQIFTEMNRVESAILGHKDDNISEISNSVAQRDFQKTDDFLPSVRLPEEMSPLPRAIITLPPTVDELYNGELKTVQSLQAETQAMLARITSERDDLKQRLVQQQSLHEKKIAELREINTTLTNELEETRKRLRTIEEEIAKTEQLRIEESSQNPSVCGSSNQQITTNSQSHDSLESELPKSLSLLAEQADRLFNVGKIQEASDLYQEIILRQPNNSSMLANYGVICQQLGRPRVALAALERAVEISPDDAFALNMLGIVHCFLGHTDSTHFQKAYDTLVRAAEIDPENARIRNYLGIAAFNIDKPDVAERELRKAIELSADYPEAHFNMAVVYINQDPPAFEMARRHYIRSVQLGHPRHMPTEEKLNISENDMSQLAVTGLR
jgi:tetratricopeptide (TPR) repeat protein